MQQLEERRTPAPSGDAEESAPGDPRLSPTRAREHLANERTLLAWTRTSITLIGLGFVVARFGIFLREVDPAQGTRVSAGIGIALVVTGLVAGAASVVRFFRARAQIDAGHFEAEYWPEVLLVSMVAVLGLVLVVYLAVRA